MNLLVIDIQKGITDDELYNYDTFVKNTQKLIQVARNNNVEVIYVMHDDGIGSGFSVGDEAFEIADIVKPNPGEKIYIKTVNSAFSIKELKKYLENSLDKDLMIIGLQTNFCIDSTIRSAFDNGFNVIVPLEANSTFNNEYMDAKTTYEYYNEMMWPDRFAKCVSMEEAIKLLTK